MISSERRVDIDSEIELALKDAVAFAEASPFPHIDALYTNVFAGR
jgi:TPP-dependent pyruvate/acetoin dehydrogenase alpha subunit